MYSELRKTIDGIANYALSFGAAALITNLHRSFAEFLGRISVYSPSTKTSIERRKQWHEEERIFTKEKTGAGKGAYSKQTENINLFTGKLTGR
jgi:hypothetical protein